MSLITFRKRRTSGRTRDKPPSWPSTRGTTTGDDSTAAASSARPA
jgi:hypothetical protein